MKESYVKALKLVNQAMEELFCTDDEPLTLDIYNKLNQVAEMIEDNKQ